MLLLFILIGALAIGLPLMMILMSDPSPPQLPPVTPKPAIVQPATSAPAAEPPLADAAVPTRASAENAAAPVTAAGTVVSATATNSASTVQTGPNSGAITREAVSPERIKELAAELELLKEQLAKAQAAGQIPKDFKGLPQGAKLPSEAELMKELQRVMEERAKALQ